MIRTRITDGEGSGRDAAVTPNNALRVQVVPETSKGLPPEDLANLRLLRTFLKNGAAIDMNINGSVETQEFFIGSAPGITKWITGMRVLLEGTAMEMNTADFRRFGAATSGNQALPNGLLIQAVQSGELVEICAEPIRFMGDFFSYADSYVNFVNAVSSQADFLAFDFVFDKPIVLAEGGGDKVSVYVRDNLTPIEKLQVVVRGYQEFV